MNKPSKRHLPKSNERRLEDIAVQEDSTDLRTRAMLIRLTAGMWRGKGRDDSVSDELRERAGGKGKVGTFTKHYMDPEVVSKIEQTYWNARRYHRSITLPWGDDLKRLLASQSFFAYKQTMAKFEREFWMHVDEYVRNYRSNVQAQRVRLGKMWRESDYPSEQEVRGMFRFAVLVEPIPTSDDFRLSLSQDEEKDLKRAYDEEMRARMKGAVQDVFDNIRDTVETLQGKLADPDANIRSTTFGALRKLVATLPQLNSIVQDPNITALGKQIAETLLDVDVDAVAHDSRVRKATKSKADTLLDALKPLQQAWSVAPATPQ